jgi:hypothetical protein
MSVCTSGRWFTISIALALPLHPGCSTPVFDSARDAERPACASPSCLGDAEVDASRARDGGFVAEAATSPERLGDSGRDPLPTTTPDAGEASELAEAGTSAAEDRELPGSYALITRFFGRDSSGVGYFREDIVSLATIERTAVAGKFRMQTQTCEHTGYVDPELLVEPIVSRLLFPQFVPLRSYELTVSAGRFRSAGEPMLAGYEEPSATRPCPAGTKQRHPERGWLPNGECTCPISELPPTQASDCRVVDTDGDTHPGMTVQFAGGTENVTYSRLRDSGQLIDGTLSPDGQHRASYAAMLDTFHLECTMSTCTRRGVRICPPDFNPARFVRLQARSDGRAPTCDDVLREVAAPGYFVDLKDGPPGC